MAQYLSVLELSSLDGHNGFQINGVASGDQSGWSVSAAGDVNGDGFADVIIGAPYALLAPVDGGAAYVVFGKATGFGATLNLSTLDGSNGFQLNGAGTVGDMHTGWSVSSAGDVNGDGVDDIIVGLDYEDANGAPPRPFPAYIVFGSEDAFSATFSLSALDGANGFKIATEADAPGFDDRSHVAASSAGDVNGDGFDDLLVGFPRDTDSGVVVARGTTYVVFGKASFDSSVISLDGLDGNNGFQIDGEAVSDQSGYAVSHAGDVNGDGADDILVGSRDADVSYVVFGKLSGFGATLNLSGLDGANGFKITGGSAAVGRSVSAAGDVNGDGLGDLIIGDAEAAPNGAGSGASYVVFGQLSSFGATLSVAGLDGNNGFKINGEAMGDASGCSVASAGDFNGDGFADVIVAANGADPNGLSSGASYVVFGKASGFGPTVELSGLDGNNGFQVNGEVANDFSGSSVSGAGDVNGDGFDDLIVGAYKADPNGGSSGASYLIFGAMPDEAVMRTGTDIANTIHGGDFNDTLKGLDGDDTLLGHAGKDALNGAGGADHLVGDTGKDSLTGGAGADTLDGGAKADKFIYTSAAHSSSTLFDTIVRCDFAEDRLDTPVTVTAIDATVATGTLRLGHFDSDLAAAVASLGVNHAVVFTPDAGNQAGKTYLIVDMGGGAGYQADEDLVLLLSNARHLASLGIEDFV